MIIYHNCTENSALLYTLIVINFFHCYNIHPLSFIQNNEFLGIIKINYTL